MLTGFFKKSDEKDCKCQIVKFSDRVWLDKKGNAAFLRSIVVKVLEASAIPLTELRVVLPAENVLDITSWNRYYLKEDFYFNQSHIKTTSNYKIKQYPQAGVYDSCGIIDDDGVNNIKVFVAEEYALPKLFRVGKNTTLRFRFPCPIKAGESAGLRFSFKIASLFDDITAGGEFPEYNICLPYLNQSSEVEEIGKQNEIDILPTLKGENHPGGFDVWLYLPPNFRKASGFEHSTEKIDHRIMDGTTSDARYKYGWKLRYLLQQHGLQEDSIVNSQKGLNIEVGGLIKEKYIAASDGTVQKLKTEVRVSTIIAVIALILSILIPLGIEIYKIKFSSEHNSTNNTNVKKDSTPQAKSGDKKDTQSQ